MTIFEALFFAKIVAGCAIDPVEYARGNHLEPTISANIRARHERRASIELRSSQKIAIDNVRVFDGYSVCEPTTVVIDGDTIVTDPAGARHVDGNGGVLLPGLIDSHCHPRNATELQELTRYGVTTAFSMACFEPAMCESLQDHPGLVDIKTSTTPASAPGSVHGNLTIAATNSTALLLFNSSQVPSWIANQTSWGPNVIKAIAESPGLDESTLKAIATAAHDDRTQSVCHAADYKSYNQAVSANFDQVHHTPLDKPVDQDLLDRMFAQLQVSAPTLTMMQAIAEKLQESFAVANASANALHAAKIPILAGTDSNQIPGFIANVPFGSSLHLELELLVAAGLDPVEALRAATANPAWRFGFYDRGVIAPGKRADLILISGDPTKNISKTRNIERIWVAGIEYEGPLGT